MVEGLNLPFQSMVMVKEGMPVLASCPQSLLLLVPVEVNVPPLTPDVPVQASLPVKVKVADVVPPNRRPGATTNLPLDTVHPRVPEALTSPFAALGALATLARAAPPATWPPAPTNPMPTTEIRARPAAVKTAAL
jgi:hypothetical protein